MLKKHVNSDIKPKVKFARSLRKSQTPGEKKLWSKLKDRRFHNLKFRRQVPYGPYIVDFLCVDKQLIIEIDGDSHFQIGAKENDDKRAKYLRRFGFKILRFTNNLATKSIDDVLTEIGKF